MYDTFDSWSDVLSFINAGGWLWYHAPLDARPCSVRVVRVFKNGKVRLDPGVGADQFTADSAHLSRMRKQRKTA
jgi:hypothetical protein